MFVSLTRLRIRSWRFFPLFAMYTTQSIKQVRSAPGFQVGKLLPDRDFAFWTLTGWDKQESMRQYMISGSHAKAMPKLMHWCDEASVAHWEQESAELPDWEEADRRMRATGRVSKVKYPSSVHAALDYRKPKASRSSPIFKA